MSLNLKAIAIDATHRYRAIKTLAGLALVFMRCAFVLIGGQNHRAIGAELFIVSAISAGIFVKGYTKSFRMSSGLKLSRVVAGSLIHVAEMIGAAVFFVFSWVPGWPLYRSHSHRDQHLLYDYGSLATSHRRFRSKHNRTINQQTSRIACPIPEPLRGRRHRAILGLCLPLAPSSPSCGTDHICQKGLRPSGFRAHRGLSLH